MSDAQGAELLFRREWARLESTRDGMETRADQYASLAQFWHIHRGSTDEIRALSRLSAKNLLGHGYHKDMVLLDFLEAIRNNAAKDRRRAVACLQKIVPLVFVINDITDRDETRHLRRMVADAAADVAPEVLPGYLRMLQRDERHWEVETCFTAMASSSPLETALERALATTFVHEDALVAFQERANKGDFKASSLLAEILKHMGRAAAAPSQDKTGESAPESPNRPADGEQTLPSVDAYGPDKLMEFTRETRSARAYDGGDHLARWTNYWRTTDPDGLLSALTMYRSSQGRPLETKTARIVVELFLERRGPAAAWDWLIAYHASFFGWNTFLYRLEDVVWIWDLVRTKFPNRWLEFIVATSGPDPDKPLSAPFWSIERMTVFLVTVGQAESAWQGIEAAADFSVTLGADLRLPEVPLKADSPELPSPIWLLTDRLDCPSRAVQERAAWELAGLLSGVDHGSAASAALLAWHNSDRLEFRSCVFLLILCLARAAFGLSEAACVALVDRADLVPSIGVHVLLRRLGRGNKKLTKRLDYRQQHSGRPPDKFSQNAFFRQAVESHLAPIFFGWANDLDDEGIPFTRQWEWESIALTERKGIPLQAGVDYHYTGRIDKGGLHVSDRLSAILRSSCLRALHWSMDQAELDVEVAELFAPWVAVMSEPSLWSIRPSARPNWWPQDSGVDDELGTLVNDTRTAIGRRLENTNLNKTEVLAYAAGPIGSRPRLQAEVEIRAFLQIGRSTNRPTVEDLGAISKVACVPQARGSLNRYRPIQDAGTLGDEWEVIPLGWVLAPGVFDWLVPDKEIRGFHLPAAWIFPGQPTIRVEADALAVALDGPPVARYRYWNDDLAERHYRQAMCRVGGALTVDREWLQPHFEEGASLRWLVTLSFAKRAERVNQFGPSQVAARWIVEQVRMDPVSRSKTRGRTRSLSTKRSPDTAGRPGQKSKNSR